MIVVSEYIHEDALGRLEPFDLLYNPELFGEREALMKILQDADALIVRNGTRVDGELVRDAPYLKVVGRVGVGLDNLELPVLRERNITVTWAPGTNAVSVAEYVLGAMLEFSRAFARASAALHQGRWDRQAAIGTELYGKTLGIVGLGDIGGRLARRARAFEMNVLASDPVAHASSFAVQEYGLELTDLGTLLERADFVSLHAPLLPSTKNMMDAAALARMKPGSFLINTARGGLVDEAALADALQSGRLAGAALDVRVKEPPGENDPLRGLDNLILTPHVAGVTEESNRRASLHVAEDVRRVLTGQKPLSEAPRSA